VLQPVAPRFRAWLVTLVLSPRHRSLHVSASAPPVAVA
jgi:hypothetical protein